MFPASFEEANTVLSKPEDMTHDQCDPLAVCCTTYGDGTPVVISCWKLTAEELAEINRTGRVLGIVGGTMPPAFIMGTSLFDPQAT